MAEKSQTETPKEIADSNPDIIDERRGLPVYRSNPSLDGLPMRIKNKPAKIVAGQRAVLFDDATGEVAGEGSVAFMEREVVDPEKFMKVYIAGLDGVLDLKGAAQRVFKILWKQTQEKPDSDRVELNRYIAEDYGDKMTERTFQRGVLELLKAEFIYHSPTPGLYFTNVRFLFNGNRIVTAKEYVLKGSGQQGTLDFDEKKSRIRLTANEM